MTDRRQSADDSDELGPWNPGLKSSIPAKLLPLSTMFRPKTVETGFDEAHELADFSGLRPRETVAFRPERLIIHELLIRVTADLSVPDGPDYEELGLNMRGMTARIYEQHVTPKLAELKSGHEQLVERAHDFMTSELATLDRLPDAEADQPSKKHGFLSRLFGGKEKPKTRPALSGGQGQTSLQAAEARWSLMEDPFERACTEALGFATHAVLRTLGRLPADKAVLARLAVNRFINDYGSVQLGRALDPIIGQAAGTEEYRFLPAQAQPVVMNVKGASASGKSTIRMHQRALAKQLGVPWEDFALISPDYWRKYLLEYESLDADRKYGAMLTGHELEIIDRKLDRYMAEKADLGTMPHLLIDRFRFDSFATDDGRERGSNLLTRFGHTVFMFFMVTPPEATVERAWSRGLSTGRFKAVDDLLAHNIEAYTGMPDLFFAWALSDKKVHVEFLDNSVPKGERPRTIATGWNRCMTVFDIQGMLNIERFKRVDIEAMSPDQIFDDASQATEANLAFLKQCCERMDQVIFADAASGEPYAVVEDRRWTWRSGSSSQVAKETADILEAAGLMSPDKSEGSRPIATGDAYYGKAVDCIVGVIAD
ncbi:MAG: hypothetical protein ACR2RF_09820 [Geminicoccaceae bacterium]